MKSSPIRCLHSPEDGIGTWGGSALPKGFKKGRKNGRDHGGNAKMPGATKMPMGRASENQVSGGKMEFQLH